jgi:hypothetical protein
MASAANNHQLQLLRHRVPNKPNPHLHYRPRQRLKVLTPLPLRAPS